MTGSVMLYLALRTLHVVLAAAWFGAAMFTTLYLGPALREIGPGGGQLTIILVRRGLEKYFAAIGGLTIVLGFYLFWRLMGDPAFPSSHRGMAISTGALLGLIALILSGSMIGGSTKKLAKLSAKAMSLPEGPERAALLTTMGGLNARIKTFSPIVTAMLFLAMVLMAMAHLV